MSDWLNHNMNDFSHHSPSKKELAVKISFMEHQIEKQDQKIATLEAAIKELKSKIQTDGHSVGYLTTEEVTDLLKMCSRTLYSYRKQGRIKGSKFGGKLLFRKADVEQLLDEGLG
ncbi:MAG: helix-turn-helix domain-containing protein [Bacteroidales bacterium]|nr:helix-turn-helix domain-containing protein [Bacteroidales bacterium]